MTGSTDDQWRQLGIAPTADESAIRRAYAIRLRQVRPDDDPAGFQRLVEARDHALQLAQQGGGKAGRWQWPEDSAVAPEAPSPVEPAAPPQPPPPVKPAALQPAPQTRPAAPPSPPPVKPVAPPPSAHVKEAPVRPAQATRKESRHGEELAAVLDLLDTGLRVPDGASHPVAPARNTQSPDSAARRDAGWEQIADQVARLSMAEREAVQPHLIRRLSAYVERHPALRRRMLSRGRWRDGPLPFADWPRPFWPFFDLVAGLDAEFSWRVQDRIIHLCLPPGEADHFIALLAWAHTVADAGPGHFTEHTRGGLLRIREIDAYAFYDSGRDGDGLRAFRAMRENPALWRADDAATDLFFPIWSLRDGHYLKAVLGLIGWASLIAPYVPWPPPGVAQAFPWVTPEMKPALLDIWLSCLAIWILLGSRNGKPARGAGGLPWDWGAAALLPFWAFARGLYIRAVIVMLAWGAASHAGPLFLALSMHGAAGAWGQRWVAYKLLRTVDAADRAKLSDAAERFRYIRRRRTAGPKFLRWMGGRFGKWLAIITAWLLFQAVMRFLLSLK